MFFDLGLIDYESAYSFQKEIFEEVKKGKYTKAVIFCRHHPVITLGRLTKKTDLLISESQLSSRNIQVRSTQRGGELTYHGPGQLLVYPIFDLNYFKKDIRFFISWLEELIIELLAQFGITAIQREGLTGVWVGEKKIASIGIAIRNWITLHGFSINIEKGDLENFHTIRPCGMDIAMTSMEDFLGRQVDSKAVKDKLVEIINEGIT